MIARVNRASKAAALGLAFAFAAASAAAGSTAVAVSTAFAQTSPPERAPKRGGTPPTERAPAAKPPPTSTAPVRAPSDAERRSSERAMEEAIVAGNWRAALAAVEAFLAKFPDDALMLYNAACCKGQLGDLDAAFADLRRAIDAGYGDLGTAAGDPDLAPLRDDPRWIPIRERLKRKLPAGDRGDRSGESAFEAWKKKYGERRYTYLIDEERKLNLALALDETSRTQTLDMLHRQGAWSVRELFGKVQNDVILLAVAHPLDFDDFFDTPNTAGVYDHRHRRLVSRDTGASLRHEFVHLLHWGHMDRLRQVHPVWVQEGLASLFEDYEWAEDGAPRFRANIRHNLARNASLHGNAPPWPRFFAMNGPQFMEKAELHYALARSVFEFLADRGRLTTWYRAYTESFERDPTGLAAMESAFGRKPADVEKEWRKWLAERGPVKDHHSIDPIILGIEADNSNDGVKITRVHRRTPAAGAGLKVGDVIVRVNDETVRSLEEMVMALGRRTRGQPVEIGFRRRGEYKSATLVDAGSRTVITP